MSTVRTWIGIPLSCLFAFSAAAETVRCESPQARIIGNINRTYVRMGKSSLNGTFSILYRDRSNTVSTSNLLVIDGSTQDDRDLRFYQVRDQQGRVVSLDLDLTASRLSSLRINNDVLSFFTRCTWTNTLPPQTHPASCQSSSTIGLNCHVINGSCVCHQHNGH